MPPKKKKAPKPGQQPTKPGNNKGKHGTSISGSRAPPTRPVGLVAGVESAQVQMSAASEAAVRDLLSTLRPSQEEEESRGEVSISLKKVESRLRVLYETLQGMGFQQVHVEDALRAMKGIPTQDAVLDWLCLNVTADDLPKKFASRARSNASYGGEVKVLATARPISPSRCGAPTDQEIHVDPPLAPQTQVQPKARAMEQDTSHKDWIRQYMNQQVSDDDDASQSSQSEASEIDDWELFSDVRERERRRAQRTAMQSYNPAQRAACVQAEFAAARAAATAAKSSGDRAKQQAAGKLIRELKEEMARLGVAHDPPPPPPTAACTQPSAELDVPDPFDEPDSGPEPAVLESQQAACACGGAEREDALEASETETWEEAADRREITKAAREALSDIEPSAGAAEDAPLPARPEQADPRPNPLVPGESRKTDSLEEDEDVNADVSHETNTDKKPEDEDDEEDDVFAAGLFDGDFDDSSTYEAKAVLPACAPAVVGLVPWGSGGGQSGRKTKQARAPPAATLVLPKAQLQQHCAKLGWPNPRFSKQAMGGEGARGKALDLNKGYRYSITLDQCSLPGGAEGGGGRRSARRTLGPRVFNVPDEDDGWGSVQEAQNAAATRALFELMRNQPMFHTLPSPYRELWIAWERRHQETHESVRAEQHQQRNQFIDSLMQSKTSRPGEAVSSADTTAKTSTTNGEDTAVASALGGEAGSLSWETRHHGAPGEVVGATSPASQESKEAGSRRAAASRRVSQRLRVEWERRCNTPEYRDMARTRGELPITKIREALDAALQESDAVVVSGETGSGKSTQVPQYILDACLARDEGDGCNILVTQPRRIAAISLAERVAAERCEPGPGEAGGLVGYHVRLDARATPHTRLLFCTTGILLRKLQGDPLLRDVSHVVLDEVHERSVQGDFLMMLLRALMLRRNRPTGSETAPTPLKVVLMSATLDAQLFAGYFGGCPALHAEGRAFPVEQAFLEDVYEQLEYRLEEGAPAALRTRRGEDARRLQGAVKAADAQAVRGGWGDDAAGGSTLEVLNRNFDKDNYSGYSAATLRNLARVDEERIDFDLLELLIAHIDAHHDEGAILVFLPGMGEISTVQDRLASTSQFSPAKGRSWLLALHSSVAAEEQRQVFKVPPKGVRKVVLATNIAETSITVPDVVYVVDTGRVKEMHYDPRRGMTALVEGWISRAGARQRRGRAGRVQPGRCFALYTRNRSENIMRAFQQPEMIRVPLVDLCLQVKLLQLGSIHGFLQTAIDPPKDEAITSSVDTLKEVGALDANEELTALGHHLAALPVDVHVGKLLLLGASFGCLDPMLTVAAALSYKTPFATNHDQRDAADQARFVLGASGTANSVAAGQQSDHLVVVAAYSGWQAAMDRGGARAARTYCKQNFMHWETLIMLRDMRGQFQQLLMDIGFIPKVKAKGEAQPSKESWNLNAAHVPVLKAVLCAGLYGNVAVVDPSAGTHAGRPQWTDGRISVSIHQSSVNHSVSKFRHKFLVFHEKVKTSKVFIRDCSVVSPYALLLFGGPITVKHESGQVLVDGWIPLQAAAQTAVLFKELRRAVDAQLAKKIKEPQLDLVSEGVVPTIVKLLLDEESVN